MPGFYYDPEKKRYFKITSSSNNVNAFTKESLESKKWEQERIRDITQLKESVLCNSMQSLLKRQCGHITPILFRRKYIEQAVERLQFSSSAQFPPLPLEEKGPKLEQWVPMAPGLFLCMWRMKSSFLRTEFQVVEFQGCNLSNPDKQTVAVKPRSVQAAENQYKVTSLGVANTDSSSHFYYTTVDILGNNSSRLYFKDIRDDGIESTPRGLFCQVKVALFCSSWNKHINKCSIGTECGSKVVDLKTGFTDTFPLKTSIFCQTFSKVRKLQE